MLNGTKKLSITEAAAELGINSDYLRQLCREKDFPCETTPGGHRRFDPDVLEAIQKVGLGKWLEDGVEIDVKAFSMAMEARQRGESQRPSSNLFWWSSYSTQDRLIGFTFRCDMVQGYANLETKDGKLTWSITFKSSIHPEELEPVILVLNKGWDKTIEGVDIVVKPLLEWVEQEAEKRLKVWRERYEKGEYVPISFFIIEDLLTPGTVLEFREEYWGYLDKNKYYGKKRLLIGDATKYASLNNSSDYYWEGGDSNFCRIIKKIEY